MNGEEAEKEKVNPSPFSHLLDSISKRQNSEEELVGDVPIHHLTQSRKSGL